MALPDIAEKHQVNKTLYYALTRREKDEVIELCQKLPEGPFHIVTIHNDTVLHMAAYSRQLSLVDDLLEKVPESDNNKLMRRTDEGNTVLHLAATTNKLVPAAGKLLNRAPELLREKNKRGEIPIFLAARYGKIEMFKFLDEELNKVVQSEKLEIKEFHRRSLDQATILHLTVAAEHFDLAYQICTRYEYLAGEKDRDGMTALQILACTPSAFYSGTKHGHIKQFIYSFLSNSTEDNIQRQEAVGKTHCRVPLWESIRMQKRRYESAFKLAKFLIERDTSWESTECKLNRVEPKAHEYGMVAQASEIEGGGEEKKALPRKESEIRLAQTPLILATKKGCLEIVQEILYMYPQAVEHVDEYGRNILHVAIKYRQIHIFDFVEKMDIPMRSLVRKIDDDGNSILHMVGIKEAHQTDDLRNPALLLQENLLLFERVKNVCTTDYVKLINKEQKTAEQLFASNNRKLHSEAKEWLKRTAENCSIVAVLIATVAFAAAYTVPGGSNEDTGYPILRSQPFFIIFTIADVLSITFALTSVVTFLSILTSPFQLIDFKRSLPQELMLGVTLLILSVTMMMLAFAATIILTTRDKRQWTKIALYSMAFLPVSIFVASYIPLYVSLWKNLKESLRIVWEAFPTRTSSDPVPVHSSTGTDSPTSDQARRFTGSSFWPSTLEDGGYSV